ncbi:MAG TPA: hypothetical protein VG297_15790 [Bryobacteraceae bacterium]|nr:hypothetical protein [Bryobacteraceae bacterium]
MTATFALVAALAIGSPVALGAEEPALCTDANPLSAFQGRTIEKLSITSPIYFFSAANHGLAELAEELPLKKGDKFDVRKYSAGVGQITTTIRTTFIDGFSAMRFVVTTPRLENCTPKGVEVHYIVYTSVFPPLNGRSFEARQNELQRPATTGAQLAATGRFLVVPNFGYDHTRRGFGGMSATSQAPFAIFDHFDLKSAASSDSLTGALDLNGKHSGGKGFLNQAEWHLRSTYSDVPAGPVHLKEGELAASFFGTSGQVSPARLLLHFGGAVSGGHQQGLAQDAPNSPYGDLKFAGGLEGQRGVSAFAASYGLQLGSTLQSHTVDFAKHILDFRYNAEWSPLPKYRKPPDKDDRADFIGRPHRPVTLEARFNAGYIQAFGQIPAAERFFGGNQALAPFIDGQPWDIRGEPYIRSIPENRLGSSNPSFGFGGTRFYSANLTVGKAVFGKSLVPQELGRQDFVNALNVGIKTAKGELSDTYFAHDPQVSAASDDVSAIRDQLTDLKSRLGNLKFDPRTTTRVSPTVKSLTSDVNIALLTAKSIAGQKTSNLIPRFMNTLIPKITADLDKLRQSLTAADQAQTAADLKSVRDALDQAREDLAKNWAMLNPAEARTRADQRASQDFAPAERVLDTFLYKLNAYSVAPIGIFDVARVWPSGVGARYAIGGGLRLSLVVVNFTIGYAANPFRRPGEGPGALFLNLDVSNLFH